MALPKQERLAHLVHQFWGRLRLRPAREAAECVMLQRVAPAPRQDIPGKATATVTAGHGKHGNRGHPPGNSDSVHFCHCACRKKGKRQKGRAKRGTAATQMERRFGICYRGPSISTQTLNRPQAELNDVNDEAGHKFPNSVSTTVVAVSSSASLARGGGPPNQSSGHVAAWQLHLGSLVAPGTCEAEHASEKENFFFPGRLVRTSLNGHSAVISDRQQQIQKFTSTTTFSNKAATDVRFRGRVSTAWQVI